MRVLDLFSGTGGWSQAFLDRGHTVIRIDNDSQFSDIPRTLIAHVESIPVSDYIDLLGGPPDIILASPPCQGFSVASIGRMWLSPGVPKHPTAKHGQFLLAQALDLIEALSPTYWWLENPRGMMRRMPELALYPRTTVTYCRYGERRMKPTDLWGCWPSTWQPRAACHNGHPDHESAPRGSATGTQGIKGARDRAIIPYPLSLEVCLATELAL